jgi:hypothetical protein
MRMRRLLLLLLFLLSLCGGVILAQHGGKAEPLRIEFKRGTASAALTNTVRGAEEMEYVFAARQGQQVTIMLTSSPARSTHFELKREDDPDFKFESNGLTWSGVAPVTGDYFINVSRLSNKPGRASFTLKLAIK